MDADLRHAGFINPDLRGVVFQRANLKGAIFHERTKLELTDFEDANLEDAYFTDADLTGVLNLTQEQIDQADGDANAKLPPYLQRPGHWETN